jgi:hypothetical protein
MKTTKDLADYMRRLRNAAPQQFAEFHAVFAEYTKQKTIDLINTTTDLQLAQGHAQQCAKLLGVFEEVKNG